MFSGMKFEVIEKQRLTTLVNLSVSVLDTPIENAAMIINQLDQWASTYGYEFHGMAPGAVIFKRAF